MALWPALTLFAVLSAVGTLIHLDSIDERYYADQLTLHLAIVRHGAPVPYQYRVLQPGIVHVLLKATRAEPGSPTYRLVFLYGYAAIRFAAIFVTLTAVLLALRRTWAGATAALAAALLAAFLPFTY